MSDGGLGGGNRARIEFSTPPSKRIRLSPFLQGISPTALSTPPPSGGKYQRKAGGGYYKPPLPSPLGYGSPATPGGSPRIICKTKDCEECRICSDDVFEVRHPHISSQQMSSRQNRDKYRCNMCKIVHTNPVKASGRMRVVLGSSTLHNIWQTQDFRPAAHIDFDTIIGGRIHDVHASFLNQYESLTNPMDVLLACGVNNIPTCDSAELIIMQFKSFVATIKQHSTTHNHREPNRVVISSIHFAPKYADPNLHPKANMTEKVRRVNAWIKEFNSGETGEHLNLHLHGVRGDPQVDPVQYKFDEWNENDRRRMLHFAPFVKSRIAKDMLSVFNRLDDKRL